MTRGLFRWLSADASDFNAQYPVAEPYRTKADAIYSGTLAALAPSDIDNMLMAMALAAGSTPTIDAFVGLRLKSVLSGWGEYDPDQSETNVPLQRYVHEAAEKAFLRKIDFFEFDAGTIRTHVDYNLFRDPDTGAKTGYSDISGLFLDMDKLRIAFMQDVQPVKLENGGGGVRGAYDAVLALQNHMPASGGKIVPSDGADAA